MNTSLPLNADLRSPVHSTSGAAMAAAQPHASGVSWGAIVAGAAGAASLSLILLILGTGLGLSSVSPWSGRGATAISVGLGTIAWLTFTQLAASGMGGYLAGRLRTKWAAVHTDEVYFRDTAHGFLAWAVATLVTAGLLASVTGSIVNGGVQAGAVVAGGAATTAMVGMGAAGAAAAKSDPESAGDGMGMGYFVDALFRREPGAAPAAESSPSSGEVTRIFATDLRTGTMTPEDARYVGQLVAQRTGLAQPDAEKRVTDMFATIQTKLKATEAAARDAADQARKASAGAALWLFVSLLAGAFVASLAATFGGRRRDLF